MTLQTFVNGEVVSYTKMNNVSNQTFVQMTVAQMLGLASPPAGMHAYVTDLDLDYVYDGTNWRMLGGRRIGARVNRSSTAQSVGNGLSDHTITWDTQEDDTDAFWASGDTVTIPSGFGGLYHIDGFLYFATSYVPNTSAVTLGWIKITVNGAEPGFDDNFAAGAYRAHVSGTIDLNGGDDVRLVAAHDETSAKDIQARMCVYRVNLG